MVFITAIYIQQHIQVPSKQLNPLIRKICRQSGFWTMIQNFLFQFFYIAYFHRAHLSLFPIFNLGTIDHIISIVTHSAWPYSDPSHSICRWLNKTTSMKLTRGNY